MSYSVVPQLKPHHVARISRLIQAHVDRVHPLNTSSNSQFSTSSSSQRSLPVVSRANPNHRKTSGRVYPIRKQFVFESYVHLLTQHRVCLFFRHDSLTPKEWNSVRGQLAKLSVDDVNKDSKVQAQVMRTRMISPVLKALNARSEIGSDVYKSMLPHLQGNLVCLSQRVFHPSRIQAAMNILSKHGSIPTQAQIDRMSIRKSNQSAITIDRLPFVMGIVEGKVQAEKGRVEELSRLPGLETLRQQIVGLIGSAGSRIVSTLNQARGSMIVRTVDGYRATLEKQEHPTT